MSVAGICRMSRIDANSAAPSTPTTKSRMPSEPYSQSYSSRMSGIVYRPWITTSRNAGIPRNPMSNPNPPPIRHASSANSAYRSVIVTRPYPSPRYVPISPRSSSTRRLIVVRLIITATTRNTIGNALPSDWIELMSDLSELKPLSAVRDCTYQRGAMSSIVCCSAVKRLSISCLFVLTCCCASLSCASPCAHWRCALASGSGIAMPTGTCAACASSALSCSSSWLRCASSCACAVLTSL